MFNTTLLGVFMVYSYLCSKQTFQSFTGYRRKKIKTYFAQQPCCYAAKKYCLNKSCIFFEDVSLSSLHYVVLV